MSGSARLHRWPRGSRLRQRVARWSRTFAERFWWRIAAADGEWRLPAGETAPVREVSPRENRDPGAIADAPALGPVPVPDRLLGECRTARESADANPLLPEGATPAPTPTPVPAPAIAMQGEPDRLPVPRPPCPDVPPPDASATDLALQLFRLLVAAPDGRTALADLLAAIARAAGWEAGFAWSLTLDNGRWDWPVVAGDRAGDRGASGNGGPSNGTAAAPEPPELVQRAWQHQTPQWIAAAAALPWPSLPDGNPARAALALPLLAGDRAGDPQEKRPVAVLLLLDRAPRAIAPDALERLQAATADLGLALQRQRQADRDRYSFEQATEGIFRLDGQGRYLAVNPALAAMLGYDSPEALLAIARQEGRLPYVYPPKTSHFLSQLVGTDRETVLEAQVYRRDGSILWLVQRAQAVRDRQGRFLYYEGCALDITARKSVEAQLHYNACHDPLTNLHNRAWLLEQLVAAASRSRRDRDYRFAVLFVDLDQFKRVNQSLGRWSGDRLLMAAAHRLERCLPRNASIARMDGDEFVVLLTQQAGRAEAEATARAIVDALHHPFPVEGGHARVRATIGIACHEGSHSAHPAHPQTVLRDAEMALTRAKQTHPGTYALFDASLRSDALERLQIEADLHWAVERDELRLHYQPILDLNSRAIVGFEALLRWQHPRRGLLFPNAFVPVAEERSDTIAALGHWVLEETCRQLAAWKVRYPSAFPLQANVNLSGRQLSDPTLVDWLDRLLDRYQLHGSELELEITETAIAGDPDRAATLLEAFKARHIRVCLDDFGTGYCSLSYLHQFPIDALKIDRSFTARLPDVQRSAAIVRSLLSLSQELDLDVVAEGIERSDQFHELRQFGCPYGQGYWFAKPAPSEVAAQWLERGLPDSQNGT